MRVETRQIRAFIMVADKLHFGQAAAALHLTQPALSRTIQRLEETIGEPLLIRSNRGVILTDAGRVFLEKSLRILNDLEDAVRLARQAASGEKGRLRIGYIDMVMLGKLPGLMQAFRTRYPGVDVELVNGPNSLQLQLLEEDKLDIAFVFGAVQRDGFASRVIQEEAFVVLLYPEHPLAEKPALSLDELRGEPFITGIRENWRDYRRHLDAIFLEHGFEPRVVQEAVNTEGMFALVAARMGVSIQCESAASWMGDRVVVRPLSDVSATCQASVLWPSGQDSPIRRHFLDLLPPAREA